ncbi:MAG: hypothetical protein JSS04_25110 [Proteobacteria bacterium]|nr:hypothetical protein [Pseudomonadota bacterium]
MVSKRVRGSPDRATEVRLVALDPDSGYRLIALGEELLRLMLPLHVWSEKWARTL